jgi:molybdopterin molybdotransferase
MTGAPIPAEADAVVMVEQCEAMEGGRRVRIGTKVAAGQHVQPRARELHRGEIVLSKGARLRAPEIGLLAIVGRSMVSVFPAPEVAVLSTGDELVEAADVPREGQIRNSNGPMLAVQVSQAGGRPRPLGIARDRLDELRNRIDQGLRCPVLVLSGGVSAGKLDLVPGILAELGVTPHFHKVAMKPGKPVLFGTKPGTDHGTLVFALPGNPVSAFVAFELFVRPAIDVLRGLAHRPRTWLQLPLAADFSYLADRPTYHPAEIEDDCVRPVSWHGSPDLRALTLADSLVVLPAGVPVHLSGVRLPVLRLD